jgi:hypothetical protein
MGNLSQIESCLLQLKLRFTAKTPCGQPIAVLELGAFDLITPRNLEVCGPTNMRIYDRIVPRMTPMDPMRCTSQMDNPRFTAAARIESHAIVFV